VPSYNPQQEVRISGIELANVKDLPGMQRQDKDTVGRVARISRVINVDTDVSELQAIDRDLHAAQIKLRDIKSANQLLNRRIWKAQDVLLDVYEKASIHLEEVLIFIN